MEINLYDVSRLVLGPRRGATGTAAGSMQVVGHSTATRPTKGHVHDLRAATC